MQSTVKFGVVGAGEIGQLRAASVDRNPRTQLVAVADLDESRARQVADRSGAEAFGDYHELLERKEIAAVIISTPVHLHAEVALAAFRVGKSVLCEKPLTNSLESGREVLRAAVDAGTALAVGFNHRYYPAMRYLKAAVDDGRIGDLDHLRVFGGHDGLPNLKARWMYESSLSGGGAMMDVGLHMTDLARFVLGEITEVYGVTAEDTWKVPGSEDRALAMFKSASGICATYEATWNEWKGYRVSLEAYGRLGMVRGSYAPMFNQLITQDRPGGQRKRRFKLYPEIIVREKLRGWQSTTLITFHEELADFLRMMDGQSVPLADGWDGLRAIEIAAAVHQSSESGRPVRLSAP